MKVLMRRHDDDYGDDFEENEEEEDASRRIIRMCYCCGSTRESEKSIRDPRFELQWGGCAGSAPADGLEGGRSRASGFVVPGPSAASDALKAYSEAAEQHYDPRPQ